MAVTPMAGIDERDRQFDTIVNEVVSNAFKHAFAENFRRRLSADEWRTVAAPLTGGTVALGYRFTCTSTRRLA